MNNTGRNNDKSSTPTPIRSAMGGSYGFGAFIGTAFQNFLGGPPRQAQEHNLA